MRSKVFMHTTKDTIPDAACAVGLDRSKSWLVGALAIATDTDRGSADLDDMGEGEPPGHALSTVRDPVTGVETVYSERGLVFWLETGRLAHYVPGPCVARLLRGDGDTNGDTNGVTNGVTTGPQVVFLRLCDLGDSCAKAYATHVTVPLVEILGISGATGAQARVDLGLREELMARRGGARH